MGEAVRERSVFLVSAEFVVVRRTSGHGAVREEEDGDVAE